MIVIALELADYKCVDILVFLEIYSQRLIRLPAPFACPFFSSEGHFSNVTMKISQLDGKCRLDLTQTEVPSGEYETTKAGWKSHQWDRMKAILGFGSSFGAGMGMF